MRHLLAAAAPFLLALPARAQADPCEEAERHFARGDLAEGRWVLKNALRVLDAPAEERARVLDRLARFSEETVGNFDEAIRQSERLREIELASDHPLRMKAMERIVRLKSYAFKYRDENALLDRARVESGEPEEIQARVVELRSLIGRSPGYPGLARAHYYLGASLLALKRYGEAHDAFRNALELKPGLGFYLPVNYRDGVARGLWLRQTASGLAWALLGLILLAAAALFYSSRPWKCMGARHVLVGAGVVVLWWVAFAVSSRLIACTVGAPEDEFEEPAFVGGSPGSPGSEVLGTLFRYGLLGVAGAFVIAAGAARLRPRWTWSTAGAAVSLALFGCLVAVFCLRHCERGGFFLKKEGSRLPGLLGTTYFVQQDIEPFVLTNPRAYPGLDLDNIDEPAFRAWVDEQWSREKAKEAE